MLIVSVLTANKVLTNNRQVCCQASQAIEIVRVCEFVRCAQLMNAALLRLENFLK